MAGQGTTTERWLDFGEVPAAGGGQAPRGWTFRNGLRLATPSGALRGPEKYKQLDLRRRRAQIRARRVLGLT
jgi:hypothetical protein